MFFPLLVLFFPFFSLAFGKKFPIFPPPFSPSLTWEKAHLNFSRPRKNMDDIIHCVISFKVLKWFFFFFSFLFILSFLLFHYFFFFDLFDSIHLLFKKQFWFLIFQTILIIHRVNVFFVVVIMTYEMKMRILIDVLCYGRNTKLYSKQFIYLMWMIYVIHIINK